MHIFDGNFSNFTGIFCCHCVCSEILYLLMMIDDLTKNNYVYIIIILSDIFLLLFTYILYILTIYVTNVIF